MKMKIVGFFVFVLFFSVSVSFAATATQAAVTTTCYEQAATTPTTTMQTKEMNSITIIIITKAEKGQKLALKQPAAAACCLLLLQFCVLFSIFPFFFFYSFICKEVKNTQLEIKTRALFAIKKKKTKNKQQAKKKITGNREVVAENSTREHFSQLSFNVLSTLNGSSVWQTAVTTTEILIRPLKVQLVFTTKQKFIQPKNNMSLLEKLCNNFFFFF